MKSAASGKRRQHDEKRQWVGPGVPPDSRIAFFVGDARSAVERLSKGGLLVVPAAPALRNLAHDVAYREALLGADIAIADSSLMVMPGI